MNYWPNTSSNIIQEEDFYRIDIIQAYILYQSKNATPFC